MTKLAFPLAAAVLATGFVALEVPAEAQASRVAEIIVYGDDPCPRSTDDEIVVCARKPEAERYRIPEMYRSTGPRQLGESWAARARSLETVGKTGINSCSAVGPGGHTGCLEQLIDEAQAQQGQTVVDSTPPD